MELAKFENTQTMSSREIAELTIIRHDSVKRSIETLRDKGIIQSPQSVNFKNINNVEGIEYLVGKRDSYIIVAQISPEFTARLVDRWQELENKTPVIKDPQLALIISMAQRLDAIKTQQDEQKVAIEANISRLDSIEAKNNAVLSGSGFYSVAGFASLHGIKLDIKAAATYGRKATAESNALGVMIGSIPDPRFGKVHTYHEEVLAGVFAL